MITSEYQRQLLEFREKTNTERKKWGSTAHKNAGKEVVEVVERLANLLERPVSVLDFGAGEGTLKPYVLQQVGDRISEFAEYDPGVPGKMKLPTTQFDLVVSTDVMEHVEPDMLAATIQQLASLARFAQFHAIACGPTTKRLPDGRDVHLIQEDMSWWETQFADEKWRLMEVVEKRVFRRGNFRQRGHLYLERAST